jgi:hypothetical protein
MAMQANTQPLDLERLAAAKKVIEEFGRHISPDVQQDILAQRVSIGMPPYEASLAAGAFTFQVSADPAKWPKHSDPYKVIQAQSLHPDESEIWMFFANATQFPDRGLTPFKVFVKGGRIREIHAMPQGAKS